MTSRQPSPEAASLEAIAAATRRPEAECVAALLAQARLSPERTQSARATAEALVKELRDRRIRSSGVDALMREFSLSSQEGVALMCLAEALLRIPDAATADALIRDKLARGDWRSHIGRSGSLFVNAAAWGLMVSGQLVATHSEEGLGSALTRLLARGGEPLIRKGVDLAMRLLGQQFVTGQTIEEALERARPLEARGYRYSYDMLGEAALTAEDARRYLAAYEASIHAIGRGIHNGPGISVKLSALHPRYCRAQRERVLTELLPRLAHLCRLARHYDIGLSVDAEESERLALSLELIETLAKDQTLKGWDGLGVVVQAYQKRCPIVIDWLAHLASRCGRRFMVRLVKGAYWDSEIKRAQQEGQLDYPVFTRKVHTDVSYLACARRLLAAAPALYPQFATHNALTLAAVLELAGEAGVRAWEFQCLHGMGEALYDQVVGKDRLDRPCRIYAPVGSHDTLLAYLVRRLLENGANSSFVHRIVDSSVSVDELLEDPVARAEVTRGLPHPGVELPAAMFGATRRNSAGMDLNDDSTLASFDLAFAGLRAVPWASAPILADADSRAERAPRRPVTNPADREDLVGWVSEATAAEVDAALAAAAASAPQWAATPAEQRAHLLDAAADLLESRREPLLALLMREAGKTLGNAVGEVREAADFLRYYAACIRRPGFDAAGTALGPVAAISPWNFPLAIFIGQIAGALAAGNVVLAKPAEQTPLVAAEAVRRLHEAGLPRGVLQLVPGDGAVGARIVADARVRGVVFTGSTEVATLIDRALAGRTQDDEIPLIAETGGQNVLIADSSCLPEQVIADAVVSAFDSAGQRCSALRVLCVQEDVADKLQEMLAGALAELRLGDPARLDTDVGPVIDDAARATIDTHLRSVRGRVHRSPAHETAPERGTFCAPAVVEIDSLEVLEREVFGPVLHLLRFRREDLGRLVEGVNALGYGLTLGIHSRIDETIDDIVARARVGNVYVNRNMIGAVVGVQPFGGEGLSGTGPKAGGPLYVARLRRWHGAGFDFAVISARRATPPVLTALGALREWAERSAEDPLAARCGEYARTTPLGCAIDLPGPTGETNRETFHPRGRVLCEAADRGALLGQVAAALATGNRAVIAAQRFPLLPGDLPSAVRAALESCADPISADVDLALCDTASEAVPLRRALAARAGRRVRVVTPVAGEYPLLWLVVERVVSVNTAAAGGNASLMTLEPG